MKTSDQRTGIFGWALGVVLGVLSCDQRPSPPSVGSETHFLTLCTDQCVDGLSCVCGVCTEPCTEPTACAGLGPLAECVVGERSDGCAEQICDAPCASDMDCSSLGAAFACESGHCRPGTLPEPPDAAACQAPALAGNEVLCLGDAYLELTSLSSLIAARAQADGALPAGDEFRDHASSSTPFLGGTALIESEYDDALADGPARVVVMDGGAADMLLETCAAPIDETCQLVIDAVAGAEQLLARMIEDGTEHVVYFYYPDPVGDDATKQRFDVLRPLLQAVCESSGDNCHFLDLRPVFEGKSDEYVGADGLIFSEAGAAAVAQSIWDFMRDQCIAP